MRVYIDTNYGTLSIIEGNMLPGPNVLSREERLANAYLALKLAVDHLLLPDGFEVSQEVAMFLESASMDSRRWLDGSGQARNKPGS